MTMTDAETPRSVNRSFLAQHHLTWLDVAIASAFVFLTCVYTPFFFSWFWTPRAVVVLLAALPGVLALVLRAMSGSRSAQIAVGFLTWITLSALASDNAILALKGTISQDSFVLAYVGAFGLWALAQFLSPAGRSALVPTVYVAIGLNAFLGCLQMLAQIEHGNLGLSGGRAVGLTPNPIHLASYMLLGIFMCAEARGNRRRGNLAIAGLVIFGATLSFTSTRVALFAFALIGCIVIIRGRTWHAVRSMAWATVGIVVGAVIARLYGTGTDPMSRTTIGGSGRTEWWVAGWGAFRERPLLGWGVGRFRTAIQDRLSADAVARLGDVQAIPDAHNVIVAVAVAVGIPGLVLLGWFVWEAVRRSRGVYRYGIAAMSLVWLLQPVALATLLPLMILLGVAMSDPSGAGASSTAGEVGLDRVPKVAWAIATTVGVVAAGWLMVAEYRLSEAALAVDAQAFEAVEGMYFRDPLVSDVGSTLWAGSASKDFYRDEHLLDQLRSTVAIEPTRPHWWTRLGGLELGMGMTDEAVEHARRALELQPTSVAAWGILEYVGEQTGDDALRGEATEALCRLLPEQCPDAAGEAD